VPPSIRSRLTLWYSMVVAIIVIVLGLGIYVSALFGLQQVADRELTSGIDNIAAFLQHKYDTHDVKHLGEELKEHSSLLPRGKFSRISYAHGSVLYQSEGMRLIEPPTAAIGSITKQNLQISGRSIRCFSSLRTAGPSLFLIEVGVDRTEYRQMMQRLAWLLAMSIPLAAVFAALGGYWMSGRVLTPIDEITETASRIDAQNLTVRLPLLGTDDELDRLIKTLNCMFDRIETAYARVTQFTADASHELRTPVALIHSNAEYLLMAPADDARILRGIADILKESTYMAQLIGDLLTLARADRNDGLLAMELFELEEAIAEVIPKATAMAGAKNITFAYHPARRVVAIRGSRSELQRLATIFVDNAVRYTPREGRIALGTWASDDSCGFTVADSGIGIAPEDCERIFERFYRVDQARTPGDGGTGLGLAMAKSILAAHCGSVSVRSELGLGSCFRVCLPRADVEDRMSKAAVGLEQHLSRK
jgi:signal transduction histidine kinase